MKEYSCDLLAQCSISLLTMEIGSYCEVFQDEMKVMIT